jgi:hypothetical protein
MNSRLYRCLLVRHSDVARSVPMAESSALQSIGLSQNALLVPHNWMHILQAANVLTLSFVWLTMKKERFL